MNHPTKEQRQNITIEHLNCPVTTAIFKKKPTPRLTHPTTFILSILKIAEAIMRLIFKSHK